MNVVVIGQADSFVVRGMMEKMRDKLGAEVMYVTPDTDSIKHRAKWADLFIYNMDGEAADIEALLSYMKEVCMRVDRKVILIGRDVDLKKGEEILSMYLIHGSFTRPLDMNKFLTCVGDLEVENGQGFSDGESAGARKRILIVDDDTVYSMMIHSWLKDRYQISIAGSGMQALKWLATNDVDLILLDFEMPVTSGAQVLSMLRADDDFRDIPVMFLTGKNSKEHVMQVIDLKPEDYILKSIMRDELRAKLAAFFGEEQETSAVDELMSIDLDGLDFSSVDFDFDDDF